MCTALVIDSGRIRQIRHKMLNPSHFTIIGQELQRAAKKIKTEWSKFSPEDREALKALAYDSIEQPSAMKRLWLKLWGKAYMVFIRAKGQEQALYFCLDALDCFIDNILDAVERDDVGYQQVLSDTLEELNSNSGVGEPVDEQRREWLQQL